MVSNPSLKLPWKAIELYRCKVIEILCRRKLVSRGSPEVAVSRPPSSVKKLTSSAFIGPRVSIAMATKSGDCLTPVYLAIFLSEASSAAAPLTADVSGKCEGANVSGTVTSHAMDLPRCHGMSVHPSTCFSLPSQFNPLGSFFDGSLYWISQAPYK